MRQNFSDQFAAKMRREGLPRQLIDTFLHYYGELTAGRSAYIYEKEILPLADEDVTGYAELEQFGGAGIAALGHTAVICLNGGLGTTMGMERPKSLVKVKNGRSFLDVALGQIESLHGSFGVQVPFLLMNSFATDRETREALSRYPGNPGGIPRTFMQHRFPRVDAATFTPVECPGRPELEWNPPGHGDIYLALKTSGVLRALLDNGYRYALVSNIDNLGAVLDEKLLGFFVRKGLHFMMEVARRGEMDRKGGHLARFKNGHPILREVAQCHPDERGLFQDIGRYPYFNTNNLWIDLAYVSRLLNKSRGVLGLPLIVNQKRLAPGDPSAPEVLQLEAAMGSAIAVFDKVEIVLVPRSRFIPVKSCSELLALWSDRYELAGAGMLTPTVDVEKQPVRIELDPLHYFAFNDFAARFANGAPSLRSCRSLRIRGDVAFGEGVVCTGDVRIENRAAVQRAIADAARLEGDVVIG